jgi:hypothetical protein
VRCSGGREVDDLSQRNGWDPSAGYQLKSLIPTEILLAPLSRSAFLRVCSHPGSWVMATGGDEGSSLPGAASCRTDLPKQAVPINSKSVLCFMHVVCCLIDPVVRPIWREEVRPYMWLGPR